MTDSDLRELDGWIAEHVFGKTICSGEYDHILIDDNLVLLAPAFSSDPAAFALVKREVERRGWGWDVTRFARPSNPKEPFSLVIYIPSNPPYTKSINYSGRADSEELAGCLAVKAAVEGQ